MRRLPLVVLFMLFGCGGYDGPDQQTTHGVQVTGNVPFANETIQDILDRGELPPRGDREIHPPKTQ